MPKIRSGMLEAVSVGCTPGIHNMFHSVMLQSAAMNALSFQCMTDPQPSPQIVSNEEEFEIKKILKKRFV